MRALLWADWSCKHIKLPGKRHANAVMYHRPAFESCASVQCRQNSLRRSEGFKAKHRLRNTFDGIVILPCNVIEVLSLPPYNGNAAGVDDLLDRRLVCLAPFQCHCVRDLVVRHRLVGETARSRIAIGAERELDCVALPVHCWTEIFSHTFDLDVRLIYPPALVS